MKRRLLPEQSVICAIGDGANDVAMIQTAHVGIGIAGREGSHAVRASDVSIASFSDLTRLLLLHGSWSYQRSALVAQISFFKSWAFCFAQVMYSQTTAFGGTSVYDPFSIAACNALLFIPITFFAFNRPVPMATVLQRPHLYRGNADWQLLNMSTVGGWFLRAVFQSAVVYLLVDKAVAASAIYPEGRVPGYSEVSVVSFSIFLMIQCGNLCLETSTFTLLQVLALAFGLGGALVLYMLFNTMIRAQKLVDYHAFFHIWSLPVSLLLAPLAIVAALTPVLAIKLLRSEGERAAAREKGSAPC